MKELRKIDISEKFINEASYTSEVMEKIEELMNIRKLLRKFQAIGYDCDHNEHYGNLSSRIQNKENKFLCTATQTSGDERLEIAHFPIVYDFHDNRIFWKSIAGGYEPSVEASTHDGFYRGNPRIRYIAHGHFQPIHKYCQGLDSIVFSEEFRYGTQEIRERALESGRDKKILQHETLYGNWGLIIPKGHFNAFFLVGESAKAVKLGFLYCVAISTCNIYNRVVEQALEIEGAPLLKEDFSGTLKQYF